MREEVIGRSVEDVLGPEVCALQQPYVDRLEDASSPLLKALCRLERYAQACKVTTVIVFVDPDSGKVVRTLPLGEQGQDAALRMRGLVDEPRGKLTGLDVVAPTSRYEFQREPFKLA